MNNCNTAVPVYLNRLQLAETLKIDRMKIFRAYMKQKLPADGFGATGNPLWLASRIDEIRTQLSEVKL